jgi:hypothetical protein
MAETGRAVKPPAPRPAAAVTVMRRRRGSLDPSRGAFESLLGAGDGGAIDVDAQVDFRHHRLLSCSYRKP